MPRALGGRHRFRPAKGTLPQSLWGRDGAGVIFRRCDSSLHRAAACSTFCSKPGSRRLVVSLRSCLCPRRRLLRCRFCRLRPLPSACPSPTPVDPSQPPGPPRLCARNMVAAPEGGQISHGIPFAIRVGESTADELAPHNTNGWSMRHASSKQHALIAH